MLLQRAGCKVYGCRRRTKFGVPPPFRPPLAKDGIVFQPSSLTRPAPRNSLTTGAQKCDHSHPMYETAGQEDRSLMESPPGKSPFVILCILIVSQLFSWGLRFESYTARAAIISLAGLLGVTLVQGVKTKQGVLDGGRFSWRRWLLLVTGITSAVLIIESVPDPSTRIRLVGVIFILVCGVIAVQKIVARQALDAIAWSV